MRSNLLSLRNIATQMSRTQNILSTGKKVNNAIDNATSYYQARSLTHRAADLNSLLDSMSQGIQTIKAAVEGLERYDKFLEQATIIAEESYEKAVIPTKEEILSQIGENGAVVSTAQELKDAIASNKKTICVYGKIDYFENETITLKNNQKLVGTEYFTGYTGKERFSQLNMTAPLISASKAKVEISDLDLDFNTTESAYFIGNNGNMNIGNISLNGYIVRKGTFHAIDNRSGDMTVSGKIDINTTNNNCSYIMGLCNSGNMNIKEKTELNIIFGESLINTVGYGISLYDNINIGKDTVINIDFTSDKYQNTVGVLVSSGETSTIETETKINIKNANNLFLGSGSVQIEKGVEISNRYKSTDKSWITSEDYTLVVTGSWSSPTKPSKLDAISSFEKHHDKKFSFNHIYKAVEDSVELVGKLEQYQKILDQLDDMVEDSSYQGINLLKDDKLNIVFNEDRSHNFVIKGVDMRSLSAGITTRKWETKEDLANSLKELKEAISKVRSASAELGNKLSIIQTRQTFTDAMCDILEEGADKLTLADMNEVSAEYLVLQTRQQLAVNSLSLASQSSGSILGLFG